MSRGLFLFNDLVDNTIPEKQQKGRSKSLIDKRNECLLDRLFFFKKIFAFDYDHVLDILSQETFLSTVTIPKIIERAESVLYLRTLKMQTPDRAYFQKKWPYLVWDEKTIILMYGLKKTA